ncbi:MAG TPA: hypothetical protein VJI46_02535 [Candidatus Nanoarchaeia archaeon]|nr:hypothetical protein [Candidatus Nanoarchaeia archaeon]
MLSPFIQKLEFVHQFKMGNGDIDVLGKRQVMLPSELVSELSKNDKFYGLVKKITKEEMGLYMSKVDGTQKNVKGLVEQVFDTFGLGKLKINSMGKGRADAEISNSPVPGKSPLLRGVISGIFCYVLSKDVDAELKWEKSGICSFIVK